MSRSGSDSNATFSDHIDKDVGSSPEVVTQVVDSSPEKIIKPRATRNWTRTVSVEPPSQQVAPTTQDIDFTNMVDEALLSALPPLRSFVSPRTKKAPTSVHSSRGRGRGRGRTSKSASSRKDKVYRVNDC